MLGISSTSQKLHTISWERTLYHPLVRKLVNESCSAFIDVQKKSMDSTQTRFSDLMKSSHHYRCILNACIEDLNQAADSSNNTEQNHMLQEMSEIFYKAELIWSLCEVMYLENSHGVLPHLLEWIQIHFPHAVEEAGEVLGSDNPGLHSNYWKAVYGLVLQLRLESAAKLLKLHADFSSDCFQSAFELLKKMPVFSVRNESISLFLLYLFTVGSHIFRLLHPSQFQSLLSGGIIGEMNVILEYKLENFTVLRSYNSL